MLEYLLAFVFLSLVMAAMSIGVIFANKPIKGSCGGMSALGFNTECDICGGDQKKCDTSRRQGKTRRGAAHSAESLAYDANDRSRS